MADGRDFNKQNEDNIETFQELSKKALKFSLIAITNILIKNKPALILDKKLMLIDNLLEYSRFEADS